MNAWTERQNDWNDLRRAHLFTNEEFQLAQRAVAEPLALETSYPPTGNALEDEDTRYPDRFVERREDEPEAFE